MSYSYQEHELWIECRREEFPGLAGAELLIAALIRARDTGTDIAIHFGPKEAPSCWIGELSDSFGVFGWSVGTTGNHGPNGEKVFHFWLKGAGGKVITFEPDSTNRPQGWTHSRRFGWQSAKRLKYLESYHGAGE